MLGFLKDLEGLTEVFGQMSTGISGPKLPLLADFFRSLGNGVRKNGVCNRVRIDDVWSILKFRIGFPFGEISDVLQVCVALGVDTEFPLIGSISSIGGLIAATLFAATVSDTQIFVPDNSESFLSVGHLLQQMASGSKKERCTPRR